MEINAYSYQRDWNNIYTSHFDGSFNLPWIGVNFEKDLIEFIDSIPPDARIIDIGCGDGSLCGHLANMGFTNVLGIDVSDLMISRVKSSGQSAARYEVRNVFDLPDDDEYDVVFCRHLLHHMIPTDRERLLKKLNAILKPEGGLLYLSFLSIDQSETATKERASYFTLEHQVMMYNPQHIIEALRNLGLSTLIREGQHEIVKDPYCEQYHVLIYKKSNNNTTENMANTEDSHASIKAIKDELSKKTANEILDWLNNYLESNSDVLVFSTALDAISTQLYIRGNEDQKAAPLVKLKDYTNSEQKGFFDRIFEIASKLIFRLIGVDKWNVILKMDVHNESSGLSKFSVVSEETTGSVTVHYKDAVNSKAFTLFSNYKRFCNELCKKGTLDKSLVYSVHKEFSDDKSLRFISYTFSEDKKLNRYIPPCESPVTIDDSSSEGAGKLLFFQFIKCTLNALTPEDGESEKEQQAFFKYSNKVFKKDRKKRLRDQTPYSFSFVNLGIPGFESWATLMIENRDNNDKDVKNVYNKFFVNDLDSPLLVQINSIISIVKKIDDEYNDARNKQRVENEAKKSAKAAIMSRNMSHNLGSHVMSYLKHQLSSMAAILHQDSQVLFNVDDLLDKTYRNNASAEQPDEGKKAIENHDGNNAAEQSNANNVAAEQLDDGKKATEYPDENIQTPFLLGIGRFIGYLQERQDYIATIATDYIPYGAPVNLKDAVYDELNPDLRYLRHGKLGKVEDTRNRPFNILLNYIVKSEGFSRENIEDPKNGSKNVKDITFKFLAYDEQGKEFTFSGLDNKEKNENRAQPGHGENTDEKEKENPALTEMRKVNFSLPGGLVGRQALFSIFENILRNAAKHGRTSELAGGLEFALDVIPLRDFVKDENGNYRGTNIQDRVENAKWRDLYGNSQDINSLYLLTVTDNLTYQDTDKLHERLLAGLEEDYIDVEDDFKMKSTNKGLKEIRISAAWMRSETNEEKYYRYNNDIINDQPQKLAPLIGVEFTKSHHLRYLICLPRERFATVLIDDFNDNDKELFERLNRLAPNDWAINDKNLKAPSRFIICSKDKYADLRPKTSNRLMVWETLDETERSKLQALADDEKYIEEMENLIGKRFFGIKDEEETNPPIYIWDATAKTSHSEENDVPKEIKLFSSDEGANEAQIAYRYHHSSEKEFNEFWKKRVGNKAYGKIKFIDEITGDNSSDRLVRREPLSKMWYYSHLYAMQKKVAIIDERIFEMIYGIKEELFKTAPEDVQLTINELTSNPVKTNEDVYDLVNRINTLCNGMLSGYDENINMALSDDNWQNDINDFLLEKLKSYTSDRKSENYKGIFYNLKGVDIITIVSVKGEEKRFNIIGRKDNLPKDSDSNETNGCLIGKIGEITCEDNQCKVSIEKSYKDKFDYISIHQGILDKIYESFGFKTENGSSKDEIELKMEQNRQGKLSVTQELFDKLMNHEEDNHKEDNHEVNEKRPRVGEYLPCFIIHSGRAKPSENDMPQHQPFIQYAAIEHGVQDCKFALVELLEYARYEE